MEAIKILYKALGGGRICKVCSEENKNRWFDKHISRELMNGKWVKFKFET